LERQLTADTARLGAFAVRWPAYLRQFTTGRRPPLLSGFARAVPADAPAVTLASLLAAAAPADRADVVATHVRDLAARVLGFTAAHTVDTRTPLQELGLDSLMAIELRNVLSLAVERPLPATLLFDYPTVDALAAFVETEFGATAPPATTPATITPAPPREDWVAEIEHLSEAEVEALIEQELARTTRKKGRHD
jgi:acyl carrier protein